VTAGDQLRARIDSLAGAPAYRNYLEVREWVLGMLDQGSDGVDLPSGYWREELEGFEYMLDASPLLVEKLRHHCYHLTGLKVYDYRTGKDTYERRLREKLDLLVELGGEELFVPEPAELGGFGFECEGGLFNVDTLKFYEAIIALDKGAVLSPFREPDRRRVVWEIGAGWGGMAYTFKTLCPEVSYVIVDLPQAILFSATYLKTLLPEAKFAFHGDAPLAELVPASDFVFVPNSALPGFDPPRLDLTINMVSFQEMTDAQVEAYVETARRLGSDYLYSLNRDRSGYNRELSSVTEIIARHFWPHVIPVLEVPYTKLPAERREGKKKQPKPTRPQATRLEYQHLVGWRRAEG
jgi:hypothetical protein